MEILGYAEFMIVVLACIDIMDKIDIIKQFDIEGDVLEVKPLGNGHINDTNLVITNKPLFKLIKIDSKNTEKTIPPTRNKILNIIVKRFFFSIKVKVLLKKGVHTFFYYRKFLHYLLTLYINIKKNRTKKFDFKTIYLNRRIYCRRFLQQKLQHF